MNLRELSGGFGDLGTFIPIVVLLVTECDLDPGSVLVFAGLANIVTGLLFGLPIPVQPMKAIAVVAIAEGMTPGQIAAAGLGTAALLLLITLSGLLARVVRYIPEAVVRGIQLGIGLKLLLRGSTMIAETAGAGADGWWLVLLGVILLASSYKWGGFPSALILFAVGLSVALLGSGGITGPLVIGWDGPHLILPDGGEWLTGLLRGSLPQLPLTLLNSVLAVCALSRDLFPRRPAPEPKMAVSVALMNLFGCWFGAMPMCHGSGGLAGQYRFGGRTGGAPFSIGAIKLTVGLLFGSAAVALLANFPGSILGVLLIGAGLELGLPARKCVGRGIVIVILTGAGVLFINTAAGFLVGFVAATLIGRSRKDL
ncbi:putative sulfate/molybdate transporter [candidate division KSB1 bacterium]